MALYSDDCIALSSGSIDDAGSGEPAAAAATAAAATPEVVDFVSPAVAALFAAVLIWSAVWRRAAAASVIGGGGTAGLHIASNALMPPASKSISAGPLFSGSRARSSW